MPPLPTPPTGTVALSALLLDMLPSIPEEPAVAPTEIRLFKRGDNGSDQGVFVFDDKSAELVMKRFEERDRDLVIDYEHQSMAKPPIVAEAAGWFRLSVRDGELWAIGVRWTNEARYQIESKKYRYYSPAFEFEKASRRVTEVYNAGLTNNPSLYSLPALVAATASFKQDTAADQTQEEEPMDPKIEQLNAQVAELKNQLAAKDTEIATLKASSTSSAEVATLKAQLLTKETELSVARGTNQTAALASAMGRPVTSTPEELVTAVAELSSLRKEVYGLAGKDTDAAALGVLTAQKEQAAEAATLRAKMVEVETTALKSEFGSYLDGLTVKGDGNGNFLPPGARQTAESMALDMGGGQLTRAGVEKAKAYISTGMLRSMSPASGPQNNGAGITQPPTGAALTETDLQVARQLGQDPAAFAKFVAEQHAAGRQI